MAREYLLKLGEKIDNCYEILLQVRQNGSGELYLVRDITARPFLMKVCNNPQEFEIAEKLSSFEETTGIIPIVATGHLPEGSNSYYLMPAADNLVMFPDYQPSTLAHMMSQQKRLSPFELCGIGITLLKGIKTLNSARFSYGKINPEDIYFVDGHPFLANLESADKLTGHDKNDMLSLALTLYVAYSGNSKEDFPHAPKDADPEFLSKTENLRKCLERADKEINLTSDDFIAGLKKSQKGLKDSKYIWRKLRIFITALIVILALSYCRATKVDAYQEQKINEKLAIVDAPILESHQLDALLFQQPEKLNELGIDISLEDRQTIHGYARIILSSETSRSQKDENLVKFNDAYDHWVKNRELIRQHCKDKVN